MTDFLSTTTRESNRVGDVQSGKDSPGPGQHDIDRELRKMPLSISTGAGFLSSAPRETFATHTDSPSPAEYELPSFTSSGGGLGAPQAPFSTTGSRSSLVRRTDSPGPGAYSPPSSPELPAFPEGFSKVASRHTASGKPRAGVGVGGTGSRGAFVAHDSAFLPSPAEYTPQKPVGWRGSRFGASQAGRSSLGDPSQGELPGPGAYAAHLSLGDTATLSALEGGRSAVFASTSVRAPPLSPGDGAPVGLYDVREKVGGKRRGGRKSKGRLGRSQSNDGFLTSASRFDGPGSWSGVQSVAPGPGRYDVREKRVRPRTQQQQRRGKKSRGLSGVGMGLGFGSSSSRSSLSRVSVGPGPSSGVVVSRRPRTSSPTSFNSSSRRFHWEDIPVEPRDSVTLPPHHRPPTSPTSPLPSTAVGRRRIPKGDDSLPGPGAFEADPIPLQRGPIRPSAPYRSGTDRFGDLVSRQLMGGAGGLEKGPAAYDVRASPIKMGRKGTMHSGPKDRGAFLLSTEGTPGPGTYSPPPFHPPLPSPLPERVLPPPDPSSPAAKRKALRDARARRNPAKIGSRSNRFTPYGTDVPSPATYYPKHSPVRTFNARAVQQTRTMQRRLRKLGCDV